MLHVTRNKKKKHDKILMLAKSIDMGISHQEFTAIFKEKDKYEKMKEDVRNVSEKLEEKTENMRLNSVNSRNIWNCCVSLKQKLKRKTAKTY